jgi:hypothetical protein
MKVNMKYLDNNHYAISRESAILLCKQYCQTLPRLGYERLIEYNGELYWCKRTIHNGKQVWCLHGPVNKQDLPFQFEGRERMKEPSPWAKPRKEQHESHSSKLPPSNPHFD